MPDLFSLAQSALGSQHDPKRARGKIGCAALNPEAIRAAWGNFIGTVASHREGDRRARRVSAPVSHAANANT